MSMERRESSAEAAVSLDTAVPRHGGADPSLTATELSERFLAQIAGPVRSGYLICATPRTGSTLLFDALMRSGRAGRPDEYFDDRRWVQLALMERLGIATDRGYFARILDVATTPNGVCGLKIHWHQTGALREKILCAPGLPAARLDRLDFYDALHLGFRALKFIWLRRKNRVAQAISLYLAAESQLWRRRKGARAVAVDVPFDFAAIDRLVHRIDFYERAWEAFFRAYDVRPLMIVYEDFAAGYEPTVRGVLDFLGQSDPGLGVSAPALQPQANDRSREWEQRYRVQAGAAGPHRRLAA